MRKFLILFLSAFAFANFGCTTTAKTTALADLPAKIESPTGAIFSFKFTDHHNYIGKEGCNLSVVRTDKTIQTLQEIHFTPGRDLELVDLSPGTYGYRELRCGEYRADLTFTKLPFFQIYEGKLSVVGTVRILLTQEKNFRLKIANNSKQTIQQIQEAKSKTTTLVSGYTGKTLE